MASYDDVTVGELYRVMLRIEQQTTLTNGRLQAVERQAAVHAERLDEHDSKLSGHDNRLTGYDTRLSDLREYPGGGPTKRQVVTLTLGGAGFGTALMKLFEHFVK